MPGLRVIRAIVGVLLSFTAARADAAQRTPSADMALLEATQDAFRAVSDRVRPFLVRIETVGGSQPQAVLDVAGQDAGGPDAPGPFRETLGSGFVVSDGPTTGIVYSPDGYIITSSFNFVRDPVIITVILADGRRFVANLVARDQVRKLALLRIDAAGLQAPAWGDPRDTRVGQWAVALGLGLDPDQPSISVGIISALRRMNGTAIQTDAKLNPANYGGPVCDIHGNILGMAVPMGQRPGELAGVELYDSGVGFALSKDRIDEIVAVLATGRSIYRGWLGVSLQEDAKSGAVVITNVANPSPMKEAGAEPGDRIHRANSKPIKNFGHLVQALYLIPAGERVPLTLLRGEREIEVTVTLARITDLGPLPALSEPSDPSQPATEEPESE